MLFKTGPGKAGALRGATDIVPPRDTAPARFSRYDRDIRDGQAFYGIPEAFMRAVIKTESDYDPNVVSSVGAQGLMQLMPETARLDGRDEQLRPAPEHHGRRALPAGAGAALLPHAGGDRRQQAARRAPDRLSRPTRRSRWSPRITPVRAPSRNTAGIPPYETTRQYVGMVMRRYEQYRIVAGDGAP